MFTSLFLKVRQKDFTLYILFLVITTAVNFLSIKILSEKFGINEYANFNYVYIFIQIILSLSDLGIKYSYFRSDDAKNKINLFFIISKILIASTIYLFLVLFFFKHNTFQLYLSFFPLVVANALFPNFLFQYFKLYSFIGLNGLIIKLFPLFLLRFFNNIHVYGILMGVFYTINSILAIYFFRKSFNFKFSIIKFKIFFLNLLSKNIFLNISNFISLIEINLQSIISKWLLSSIDFNLFIYTERIIAIFKQASITLFEFLYPKITSKNLNNYNKFNFVFIFLYACFLIVCWMNFEFIQHTLFKGFERTINTKYFIIIFLSYPFFIIRFNFLDNIVFIKNGFDKYNVFLQILQIFVKVILLYFLYTKIGLVIIPITLIIIELLAGGIKKTMNYRMDLN